MANVKDIVKDFYTVEDAMAFDEKTVKELQHKHLNKVRNQLSDSFFFTKAEGSKFWDEAGNVHLDFNTGVGVTTVGSNNPFVWEKIKKVVESKQHIIGAIMYHNVAAAFAHDMGLLSPGGKLTKMGTATGGAEAIEGCIKLVKIASRNKKDKTRILACENAFHGKTTGAVSVGGKEQWRKFQHPLMECVDHIPFGDAEALEKALATGQYKAFFVEPIQGEAGVKTPPKGYLKKVRELCTEHGIVLIVDDVRAGFRLDLAGSDHFYGFKADLICFCKALANGYNVSALCGRDFLRNTVSGLTYTGSYWLSAVPFAAGAACVSKMKRVNLPALLREKGRVLLEGLSAAAAKHGFTLHVSGEPALFYLRLEDEEEAAAKAAGTPWTPKLVLHQRWIAEMVRRGVYLTNHHNHFLNYSLSDDDITTTLSIADEAFAAL